MMRKALEEFVQSSLLVHSLQDITCSLLANVTSIQSPRRLEKKHFHFVLGKRLMFHTPRDNKELPWVKGDITITQMDH